MKLISPIVHFLELYLKSHKSFKKKLVMIKGNDYLVVYTSSDSYFSIKGIDESRVLVSIQRLENVFATENLDMSMFDAIKWLDENMQQKEESEKQKINIISMYNTLLARELCEQKTLILSNKELGVGYGELQYELSYYVSDPGKVCMRNAAIPYLLPEKERSYLRSLIEIGIDKFK